MRIMTHIQFVMVDPRKIIPSPWNANVVSHENEQKLKQSLARHGMFKPLLVRELDNQSCVGTEVLQCIGGWHRCEQAIELGMAEVPVINLGVITDERAKEISLADNARYGIDDTLKLSEILGDIDVGQLESFMPWTQRDIETLTASLSVDIDNLDLDEPEIEDDEEAQPKDKPERIVKTHRNLRFRNTIPDAERIANLLNKTMQEQGFVNEDDMTNAGDALAFLLLKDSQDAG